MPTKPFIAIVGPSGSGKSTSLRNLPPKETRILDMERKGFPFQNVNTFKDSIKECIYVSELVKQIEEAKKDPNCKYLVIESFSKFIEALLMYSRTVNKNYEIYNYYNETIRKVLDSLKGDKFIAIVLAIDEIVKIPQVDGSETSARRIKVQGKEHEGMLEKEFLCVFFTEVKKNPTSGKMEYYFQTNTDGVTSCKTPMDMFKSNHIPNDVFAAIQSIEKYYV